MSDKSGKRIGIFGFGCVGQGLYDVLEDNQRVEVVKICVRDKEKERGLPSSIFAYDPQELLQDERIDLLAELISDPAEALLIVRQALKAGKTIVSANKKMVSENLAELVDLQLAYGGVLLYEAAVGGSIPILRTLEAYYGNEPLQEISGILNGSSNYILSKLDAEDTSYQQALQQAQELGFAEADPTLDVGGFDAAHKISIASVHAFGVVVPPQDILRFGISAITKKDITLAQALGVRIRLVASAKLNQQGRLEVQVLPTFVYPDSELYYVNAEFNGVQLTAKFAGSQFLKGRGAGSHPTGSAVWADVAAALEGYKYNYPKLGSVAPELAKEDNLKVYLRTESPEVLPCLPWKELISFGVENEAVQLIGTIRRQDLLQYQEYLQKANVFIAQVPLYIAVEEFIKASLVAVEEAV